jgi:transcriptional regulator with PAS, ATPase and Fis domain
VYDREGMSPTLTTNQPKPSAPRVAALFAVLSAQEPFAPSSRHLLAGVDEVEIGRGARGGARGKRLVLSFPDRWLSTKHARLRRQGSDWTLEDLGSKNGALRNGAAVERTLLHDGDVIELGHSFFVFRSWRALERDDQPPDVSSAELPPSLPGLASLSPPLAARFAQLMRAAVSPVPILLRGESGTGKELLARAIHDLSLRPGAFVGVNCGALPRTLLESELFGFKKGSFSGATQDKVGLIAASDHGTLFLDEIGELAAEGQAALLRVLQEREVLPIGATRAHAVDLRVVSATHRDLEATTARGEFRADLHARLNGFELVLPALRERREDLGLLVAALLTRTSADRSLTLSHTAARALFARTWPGNVRELERALQVAVVMATSGELEWHADAAAEAPRRPPESARLRPVDRERRATLEALLREHRGNVAGVARALGKPREQVHRWIRRVGLDADAFRE